MIHRLSTFPRQGDHGFFKSIRWRGLAALFLCACLGVASAASGMTLHQAVAKVRHDTGGKILSAQTVPHGKRMVHRIRVLMKNGKVRVVSVAGKARKPR